MAEFRKALDKVLKADGGYVNDRGVEAKFCISKEAYPSLWCVFIFKLLRRTSWR